MEQFEKAAKFKALGIHAGAGRWEACERLVEELGSHAWRRKSLMGSSPEEAGFDLALKAGARPGYDWIASMGVSDEEAKALEKRALEALAKGASPDKASAAMAWLGAMAGSRPPWHEAFSELSQAEGVDADGFCKSIRDSLSRGKLDPAWSDEEGFWSLAGKASLDFQKALAISVEDSGLELRRVFRAATLGAPKVALQWIEGFSPESALALLAACACPSEDDWEHFESLAPRIGSQAAKEAGVEGRGGLRSWRALAALGAGLEPAQGFDELGIGSSRGALGKHQGRESSERGWRMAVSALAKRALPAMSAPGMESVKTWMGEHLIALDPLAAQEAVPELFDAVDFENSSAQEIDEAVEASISAGSLGLASISAKAARRLHRIAAGNKQESAKPIRDLATRLWCAPNPAGFDAFMQAMAQEAGSARSALEACGFPWAQIGRRGGSPGSAGQVISLLRLAGARDVNAEGEPVWFSSSRHNSLGDLWSQCQSQAAMGIIVAGGGYDSAWSCPMPESIGPVSSWGAIDLRDQKWSAHAGPVEVANAWESAFEAIAAFAIQAMGAQASVVPFSGDALLACPPWRRAWLLMCDADAEPCASWAAKQWLAGGEGAQAMDRFCFWMDDGAKRGLGDMLHEAFREKCLAWSNQSSSTYWKAAQACRAAATALGRQTEEPYSESEAMCAAAMAGASFGIAGAIREGGIHERARASSLISNGRELAAMMPEAASALLATGFGGPKAAQMASKALWGALAMAPLGSRFDMPAWEGVPLDPFDPWTRSALAALFTKWGMESGGAGRAAEDAAKAGFWLGSIGAAGHERSPLGRSALEWAVDSRAKARSKGLERAELGCFGEGAAKVLVALGANPSELGAPSGEDALALCALLERKSSPSSIMKALLKSEKADPRQGAIWARLSSGKSTLSEKIADDLSGKACQDPSMLSLALLADVATNAREGMLFRSALSSPPVQALAPGLLGAMCALDAPSSGNACHGVANSLEQAGLAPSPASREALFLRLVDSLASVDRFGSLGSIDHWAKAGAAPRRFDPALAPENNSSVGWVPSWERFGLGEDCSVGELLLAKAASRDGEDLPASLATRDARALCELALALPPELQGVKFCQACSKFIELMGGSASFNDRIGSDSGKVFSALEALALRARSEKVQSKLPASKRL